MIVLIVAAHPDDEVLGCGGTIARHVAEGDDVNILIVAEGATSRGDEDEDADGGGDVENVVRDVVAGDELNDAGRE